MFTGIIETTTTLLASASEGDNLHLTFARPQGWPLGIDESVAHNGVCLTIVEIDELRYTVTAVRETLLKSSISHWQLGQKINIERASVIGSRLDGHIVQGHVDTTGHIVAIEGSSEYEGSWLVRFSVPAAFAHLMVEKGSICIDGVSLTAFEVAMPIGETFGFTVTIIPYTWEHTIFHTYQVGQAVNLEFDIVGKYVTRWLSLQAK